MQNLSPITVIKASGTKEPFSEEKVVRSLSQSGLTVDTASQTVDYLKKHLKDEITTSDIYRHVSDYLHKNAPTENYFNYGLKRAVMDMGPSGFPFETLVSELLKKNGFKTEVGVVTQGRCVTHEIDIIAQKNKDKYFIECKYHNKPGYKTDVQVALYTYARFLDINNFQKENNPGNTNHSWLITNTKVTSDVFDYCHCVGVHVTTWSQPPDGGLQDLIVSSRLQPVTLLSEVPQSKRKFLLDMGIVTCTRLKQAILNNETHDLLNENEKDLILKEISSICKENE